MHEHAVVHLQTGERATGSERRVRFKYGRIERARRRRLKEREDGRRPNGGWGGCCRGEHGEIKAALQSQSRVGPFESWRLSAGTRTNIDKCDAGKSLHAKLHPRAPENTHRTPKHIITTKIKYENTKINVISIPGTLLVSL